jgi:hypothetical protein
MAQGGNSALEERVDALIAEMEDLQAMAIQLSVQLADVRVAVDRNVRAITRLRGLVTSL